LSERTRIQLAKRTTHSKVMKARIDALKLTVITALVAAGITLLSGCGGGGATFHASGNKTLGQELQDLQQAYDKGIISKKEYEDTKEKLIEKYTE
jgi:hypothetical protein